MQNGTEHYSPAFEHEYLQEHMVLNGVNAASAWVWDLTVLTDYMASQPTLFDPERIGVAGCSGGGVQTAYLGAVDDRIVAASIACYSSTIRVDYAPSGMGGGGGPAEGEQQWGPSMVAGAALLDKPDLLQIRAPKPTQVLLTTRDQYFPLVGGEAAVNESMPAFEALAEKGAPPALTWAVGNMTHGYANETRLAMYAFLSRTMLHANDSGVELDGPTPAFDFHDMRVTSTGSVLTAPEINSGKGSATMHQAFSVPLTNANLAALQRSRVNDSKGFLATVAATAAEVVGFRAPPKPTTAGLQSLPGRKFLLAGEGACKVALAVLPANVSANGTATPPPARSTPGAPTPTVLYVSRKGSLIQQPRPGQLSAVEADRVAAIQAAGFAVVLVDPCGFGALGDPMGDAFGMFDLPSYVFSTWA